MRTSRGRRMRLRESFFSGRISRPSSKVSPSANYNKIDNEGQTLNLDFLEFSFRPMASARCLTRRCQRYIRPFSRFNSLSAAVRFRQCTSRPKKRLNYTISRRTDATGRETALTKQLSLSIASDDVNRCEAKPMRDFQSVFGYLPQIVPALLGDLTADFANFLDDGFLLTHLLPPDLHSR